MSKMLMVVMVNRPPEGEVRPRIYYPTWSREHDPCQSIPAPILVLAFLRSNLGGNPMHVPRQRVSGLSWLVTSARVRRPSRLYSRALPRLFGAGTMTNVSTAVQPAVLYSQMYEVVLRNPCLRVRSH